MCPKGYHYCPIFHKPLIGLHPSAILPAILCFLNPVLRLLCRRSIFLFYSFLIWSLYELQDWGRIEPASSSLPSCVQFCGRDEHPQLDRISLLLGYSACYTFVFYYDHSHITLLPVSGAPSLIVRKYSTHRYEADLCNDSYMIPRPNWFVVQLV